MTVSQIVRGQLLQPGLWRFAAWLLLALAEMMAVSYLFEINATGSPYGNPIFYATAFVRLMLIAVPVFAFLAWPRRQAIFDRWLQAQAEHNSRRALAINIAIFAVLAVCSAYVTAEAARRGSPPRELLLPYLGLVAVTGLSLVRVDVPLSALFAIGWSERWRILVAVIAGMTMIRVADDVISLVWPVLADATLKLSAGMVALIIPGVEVNTLERSIAAGGFKVIIDHSCSGYEGLALVAGFVSIYLWTFRRELRFPAAFLLYPLGLVSIWLLNSVRIAVLSLIGITLSPQIAAQGFHSQAGWISFLLVSIGLMALSHRLGLLSSADAVQTSASRRSAAEIYLVPFIALMAGSIVVAMLAPYDRAAYVIKAGMVAATLVALARYLAPLAGRISLGSVAAGGVVGVAWILTDGKVGQPHTLGAWLADIGPMLAVGWLLVRGVGSIVLVPIAEELAFRGYLYRRLIDRDFTKVAETQFSWLALIVSSALFGLLHDRWMAAALSGVVFALVMVRSGTLRDAVASHATANATIFLWAILCQQWSLL